ncbi:hypothetical protein [Micromonospora violae]|uniref:hypothetical protein n=1 Tax=Micromonospora violae TaxID=1278207 RepID=UPI00102C6A5A|nr:hypothetical protein [Micromonospora violae]
MRTAISPASADPPDSAPIVEYVGEALTVRTEADPSTPALRLAASLPAEQGRRAVVSAPSMTARPDLFEQLVDALFEHLGGVATGVRLVPLGSYAPSVDLAKEVHLLAEWIGQEVTFPQTELTVSAGAVLQPVPWRTVDPEGAVRSEPPWPPLPSPAPLPPPAVPPPPAVRLSVATRWPHVLLHTNGGLVDLPGRRPPRVLSPARPAPRAGRGSSATAATVPATMPGVRTAAGWSFVDETVLGNAPILAGFLVEISVRVTGFRLNNRPVPPRALAKLIEVCRAGDTRPLVLVTYGVPVRGGAADLLFGGLADALTAPLYVADGPVTRTATGLLRTTGGFALWGRRQPGGASGPRRVRPVGAVLPPRPSARVRRRTPRPARSHRLGTAVPTIPAQPTAPAQSDGAEPVSAPTPIVPEILALLTSDHWIAHPGWPALLVPVSDGTPQPGDTGSTTTSPAGTAAEEVPTSATGLGQPEEPTAVVVGWQPESLAGVAGALAAPPSPEPVGSPPPIHAHGQAPDTSVTPWAPRPEGPSGPAPRWLVDVDGQEAIANPGALRQALDGRYDAHARVVARTLAQSPGLRAAAGGSRELAAGLVAVRAYCCGERDLVNQVLRGGGPDAEVDRLLLVARSAGYGLRRLPSVLGPVFQHGLVDPGLAAVYRPGDEVVEPAFVDVDLTPTRGTGTVVRFVIWSVTARRLDALDPHKPASAIFPPGSRFQVLAVDDTAPDGSPRVLLRDLKASYRGGRDSAERVLDRLRDADQGGAPVAGDAVPLSFAPGLDDAGRPYPAPALARAVTADEDE